MFKPEIEIQPETTKNPITLIGRETGICYGSDISDNEKNYKRGLNIIKKGHYRGMEFPQVYLTLSNISARVGREWYTHIGGAPTRLQGSTRYINYAEKDQTIIIPPSINKNQNAEAAFKKCTDIIFSTIQELMNEYDIPKEDAATLLPLCMGTTIVTRTNARNLMDMSRIRMCSRAYSEYQKIMEVITKKLESYSNEWATLIALTFGPRCQFEQCYEKQDCKNT